MDPNNPKTWEIFRYCETNFRVFHEVIETSCGPEMSVGVWSPVTRSIYWGQECMSWKALAIMLIEEPADF